VGPYRARYGLRVLSAGCRYSPHFDRTSTALHPKTQHTGTPSPTKSSKSKSNLVFRQTLPPISHFLFRFFFRLSFLVFPSIRSFGRSVGLSVISHRANTTFLSPLFIPISLFGTGSARFTESRLDVSKPPNPVLATQLTVDDPAPNPLELHFPSTRPARFDAPRASCLVQVDLRVLESSRVGKGSSFLLSFLCGF
jgi:hypothetical protein